MILDHTVKVQVLNRLLNKLIKHRRGYMATINCDRLDCSFNVNGICESESITIDNKECVTFELDED